MARKKKKSVRSGNQSMAVAYAQMVAKLKLTPQKQVDLALANLGKVGAGFCDNLTEFEAFLNDSFNRLLRVAEEHFTQDLSNPHPEPESNA